MFLDTTIHSGFITDLVVPREGTCGRSADELQRLSYDAALELLHDFPAVIRCNPLVTHVERLDGDAASDARCIDIAAFRSEFDQHHQQDTDYVQYAITDRLSFLLGAVQASLVFTSALRKTPTGFDSFTSPGSGIRIHGSFTLLRSSPASQPPPPPPPKDASSGGADRVTPDVPEHVIHLVEHNETRCNFFLGLYIKATLGSSHKALHEQFKRAWNEALKRKLQPFIQ